MESHKESYCTYANVSLLVNDKLLGGVNSMVVKDFKDPESCTRISLNRVVFVGTQDLVELMRTQRFSFKLMNTNTQAGWVAEDAELETYEMSISTDESSDCILHQHLVIKTSSFVYADDVSKEGMTTKEQEDFKNLIEILKKNQEIAKNDAPSVILPASDQILEEEDARILQALDDMSKKKDKKKKKKKKK